ncbi:MAG: hypothetical protein CMJ84_03790 [Planctomycetes bacterium]|nr:hypothetical protein [Planctomycetota bacterium]
MGSRAPPFQPPEAIGLRTHFAWAGFDADGRLGAFVAAPGGAAALLRNEGDGTFVNVSHASGLGDLAPARFRMWADFDGDERRCRRCRWKRRSYRRPGADQARRQRRGHRPDRTARSRGRRDLHQDGGRRRTDRRQRRRELRGQVGCLRRALR